MRWFVKGKVKRAPLPPIVTYVGFPHFFGTNWCAKCSKCGTVLTKFAFTAEEALREADDESCRCKR